MVGELKWQLLKRPGGVLQAIVTSVDKEPRQLLRDAWAYSKKFKRELDAVGPFTRLDLIINSHGGAVNSAYGMTRAALDCKRPIRVLIDGDCGSAASFVAYGVGVPVQITQMGSIYIHMPKSYNAKRDGQLMEILSKMNTVNYMISIYRACLHWRRKDVRQMIKDSRRFKPQEAVNVGLCTEVTTRQIWEAGT